MAIEFKKPSFDPDVGDSFQFMTFSTHVGVFSAVNSPVFNGKEFVPVYNTTDVTLVVQPIPGADLEVTKT